MDQQQYTLEFTTGSRTTAGQIQTEMIHRLGLPANDGGKYFSVWLTSPHLREELPLISLVNWFFQVWGSREIKKLLVTFTNRILLPGRTLIIL